MVKSSLEDFFWELQPRLIAKSATKIDKIVFFMHYCIKVTDSCCKNKIKKDILL